jgi:hypothetical protein
MINISSVLIENPPGERQFETWEPYLWEISSLAALAILLPWIGAAIARWPFTAWQRWRHAAAHLVGIVLFSACHVALMVAIREAVYALTGGDYNFAQGDLLLQLVYELRKDAMAYALLGGIYWAYDRVMRPPAEDPPPPALIELRCNGRVLTVNPQQIVRVDAAGNYVDIFLAEADAPLLVRGTLAEWKDKLAPFGHLQVHRRHIVYPPAIVERQATRSGDMQLRLAGGGELLASRRFRDAL